MAALRLKAQRDAQAKAATAQTHDIQTNRPASPSAMAARIHPTRWDPALRHTKLLDEALVYLARRQAPAWWLRKHIKERRPGTPELAFMRCDAYDDDDMVPFTRLVVQEPPRHGKSTLNSQYFPAWYAGEYPTHRMMLASYEARLAATMSGRARDIVRMWGPTLWGRGLSASQRARDNWELEGTEGGMTSSGVRGAMTGRGANALFIDDPVKNADEAQSETLQESTWDWMRSVAMTRLEVDENGLDPIVLITMTRWHLKDLVGKLLDQDEDEAEEGEHFVVLSLPALAEADDPLGREIGEPLWPERRSLRFLEGLRRRLGAYFFDALYQQRPTPAGGGVFQRSWWRRYRVMPRKARRGGIFIDTATDDKSTGDFFAMATVRTHDLDFYWERMLNRRLSFPDQVQAVIDAREASKRTPDDAGLPVYIEEVAWSLPLIKSLKKLITRVIGVKPGGHSKLSRAMAGSPFVEGGNCYLPEAADWTADFIEQHAAFPSTGWHDDMVDTTSLALHVLGTRATPEQQPVSSAAVEYVATRGAGSARTPTARTRQQREQEVKMQRRQERQERQRERRVNTPTGTRRRGGV